MFELSVILLSAGHPGLLAPVGIGMYAAWNDRRSGSGQ